MQHAALMQCTVQVFIEEIGAYKHLVENFIADIERPLNLSFYWSQ